MLRPNNKELGSGMNWWSGGDCLNDLGRQPETHVLRHNLDLLYRGETPALQKSHDLLHQNLGRGSACSDCDRPDGLQPGWLNILCLVDQVGTRAQILGNLNKPIRVGTVA